MAEGHSALWWVLVRTSGKAARQLAVAVAYASVSGKWYTSVGSPLNDETKLPAAARAALVKCLREVPIFAFAPAVRTFFSDNFFS